MLADTADNPSHFDTHALQTTQPFPPKHSQPFSSTIGKRCFVALLHPLTINDASSVRQNDSPDAESGETNRRAQTD